MSLREEADSEEIRNMVTMWLAQIVKLATDHGSKLSGIFLVPGVDSPVYFGNWGQDTIERHQVPKGKRAAINMRFKMLAQLDIFNTETHQAGYISDFTANDHRFYFLVQTRPTPVGEEITARLLFEDDPTVPFEIARVRKSPG